MTSGTVTNGTFYARGNLASFNGTLMDCPVDAVCGYIRLSGSTFNETADFTDLGAATGTGAGGCTFNGDVTITHTGTLTYFTLANTTGDTFNGNVTFTNSSNREIHIASSGATLFNGNVILNSTSSGGISIANGGGSATLATGKTISIGSSGFSADFLTLKNFTQNGSTAQTLTLTGTAVVNMIAATFGDAAALNELVADELALETHLKAVNSLYFTKLAPGDTLDDSDSSNVLEIALLPYFEGGEASFIGIGMLGLEHTPSIPQLRLRNEVPMGDIPPAPIAQLTTIYPNPTSDFFYVKTEGVKVEKLEIYDARIKLLITIEKNIVGSAISVNYKPGVYGVKLYLITGEVKWFKLVIV
ncbi:MAG: hypothetical protein BWY67_02127 [Bacteroidetes bacterium ADurb.Bin397]|nr:MAG: hypothetical protein BWY67_02127 [Bacteroidetes bacterium ADurb.Bin397]